MLLFCHHIADLRLSFVMPALFDALVHSQGLTPHVAWRVAFVLPFVIVTATAAGMLLLCDDTPTGKWADRHLVIEGLPPTPPSEVATLHPGESKERYKDPEKSPAESIHQARSTEIDLPRGELVAAPSFRKTLQVAFSLQTLALAVPYACSFGELLIGPGNLVVIC